MAFSSPNSLSASTPSASSPLHLHLRLQPQPFLHLPFHRSLPLHLPALRLTRPLLPPIPLASSGGGSNFGGGDDDLPSGGGGDDENEDDDDASVNRREALFVLAQLGRKLESLPADMAAAVDGGRLPGEIVRRFADLEKSPLFRWLLQFGGFRERLLADDLFLAKVAMECGVGIFTKVLPLLRHIIHRVFFLHLIHFPAVCDSDHQIRFGLLWFDLSSFSGLEST
jgi:hypothetical protein